MVTFSISNLILIEETFKGRMKVNISYIVKPLIKFCWIADRFYSNVCWLGNSVLPRQPFIFELRNDFQLQWRIVKAWQQPFCKWTTWNISLFLPCLGSENRHKFEEVMQLLRQMYVLCVNYLEWVQNIWIGFSGLN